MALLAFYYAYLINYHKNKESNKSLATGRIKAQQTGCAGCAYGCVVLWKAVVIKSKGCTHYDIKVANGNREERKRKTPIKIQTETLAVIYVIRI